ncbi:hypothetical protein BU16DRAFT_521378 [Lophium mytilinum]|uniref:BCAS2 family protein n=1 Tax=Lophium mytilinum TaxID=390894 RepID=A0A6A6RCQ5_9PEZI|nr:hypothetical protein BU16DRAFT_521378 [Lophium mytilinum]
MPLISEAYDSLPYIDAVPSTHALDSARALIEADIKSAGVDSSVLHPALLPSASYVPTYSPALEQEHARLAADPKSKITGVDLSRYEGLEEPPEADNENPGELAAWTETLRKAYASSEYLNARLTELGLLERFGKNMWLVGNAQLEDILKALEAELADTKTQIEATEEARRTNQGAVKGEVDILEESWKKGVGRVLETQVAAEALKREILERRRAGAV